MIGDRWRRVLRNGLWLAAALFVVALFGPRMCGAPLLAAGTAAPPFAVTRVDDGAPLTLRDLRGRPAVLFFWAVWCRACEAMMPGLAALAAERPGPRFVALHGDGQIPVDELATRARRFPRLVVVEGGERFLAAYRVTTFPTTYVLDAEGRICGGVAGRASPDVVAALLDRCAP